MRTPAYHRAFFWFLVPALAFVAPGCGGDEDTDASSSPPGSGLPSGKGGAAGSGTGGAGGSAGGPIIGGAGKGGTTGQGGKAGAGGATTTCGNGKREGKEQCDKADLGGATCKSLTKNDGATGTVSCFDNCTLDGSKCKLGAAGSGTGGAGGAPTTCGNGKLDGTEQCDGANLGTATCASITGDPAATGTLKCNTNCTLDPKGCTLGQAGAGGSGNNDCGDGVIGAGELCDGAQLGGKTCATVTSDPNATGTLACNPNCTFNAAGCMLGQGGTGSGGAPMLPTCGDGKKNNAEQCDTADFGVATCASALSDPSATGSLKCFGNCTIDASACSAASGGSGPTDGCGDGIKNGLEQCDGADFGAITCATAVDPTSTGSPTCHANCTVDLTGCSAPGSGGASAFSCGDGVKAGAEQCDVADFGGATCATALGDPSAGGALQCFGNCTIDASACSFGQGTGGSGAGGGTGTGGSGTGGSGQATCNLTYCQGHNYLCGNCIDDDGDGLTDMEDPDCLGPCHNNESGFFPEIPGANNAPCKADCYFDQDTGSGNDDCYWNWSCDPLEVAPNYTPAGPACAYDPNTKISGTNKSCAQLDAEQSAACHSVCGPLTPNGCDCFGCCELPAESGNYVFIGTVDGDGNPTCDLNNTGDPTKCAPCTPIQDCLNTCLHCELCLGKTELPADCLPPAPVCGDGTRTGAEQCDGADLGGATCQSITGNALAVGDVKCAANCTLDASGCSIPSTTPACGDGVRTGAEQCDGIDLGGATCASLTGNPNSVGSVTCNPNCTLDGNGCSIPGQGVPGCGDGTRQLTEQCDGADVGGATCVSLTGDPGATGAVICALNCTLDGSGCSIPTGAGGAPQVGACGDNVKNGFEQCDGTDVGGITCAIVFGTPNATGEVKCLPNCLLDTSGCGIPTGSEPGLCGNSKRESPEQCDGTDFGGATCASVLGNPAAIGTLSCVAGNCLIDASGCSIPTGAGGAPAACPNGKREGSEQCDGADLGGATCVTALGNPNATGTLKCFGNCLYDASGCSVPGSGGSCGGQICSPGAQPCGLACQPACPIGEYCLTGCCTPQIE